MLPVSRISGWTPRRARYFPTSEVLLGKCQENWSQRNWTFENSQAPARAFSWHCLEATSVSSLASARDNVQHDVDDVEARTLVLKWAVIRRLNRCGHAAQLKTKGQQPKFCMLQRIHQTRAPHDSSGRSARSKVGRTYGSKDPAKLTNP